MSPQLGRTTQRKTIAAAREYLRRSDTVKFITIKDLAIKKGSLLRYVALIRENKPLPSLEQPQGGQINAYQTQLGKPSSSSS
jgi:hypothetical protein